MLTNLFEHNTCGALFPLGVHNICSEQSFIFIFMCIHEVTWNTAVREQEGTKRSHGNLPSKYK